MSIVAAFMVPHPPMIVPAVGRGSEAQVSDTIKAYEQVASEITELRPDTIVITSPHSIMYADYFHRDPLHQVLSCALAQPKSSLKRLTIPR